MEITAKEGSNILEFQRGIIENLTYISNRIAQTWYVGWEDWEEKNGEKYWKKKMWNPIIIKRHALYLNILTQTVKKILFQPNLQIENIWEYILTCLNVYEWNYPYLNWCFESRK